MEKDAISQNIASFFQSLFATSGSHSMEAVLSYIDPKITEEMNHGLMSPVSREEIKSAAFSLGSTKAPGPDGFSGKFYHSAWPEIADSVCSMVYDFFAVVVVLRTFKSLHAFTLLLFGPLSLPIQAVYENAP